MVADDPAFLNRINRTLRKNRMMIVTRCSLAIAAAIGGLICMFALPTLAADGTWKFEEVSSSDDAHRHIVFLQGNKELFAVGCSKYVGFTALYPGHSRRAGKVPMTIATPKATMRLHGELASDAAKVSRVTVLLDEVSPRPANQLLWMIDSGLPLTVSAGNGRYVLPGAKLPDLIPRWNTACDVSVPLLARTRNQKR